MLLILIGCHIVRGRGDGGQPCSEVSKFSLQMDK
jgi:hypothetical protein